jgi:hypothetical protein
MTPEQFAYWLQGYSEIAGEAPTKEQWQVIKDHLKTVFHKVTPNRSPLPVSPIPPHWPSPLDGPFDSTKVIC